MADLADVLRLVLLAAPFTPALVGLFSGSVAAFLAGLIMGVGVLLVAGYSPVVAAVLWAISCVIARHIAVTARPRIVLGDGRDAALPDRLDRGRLGLLALLWCGAAGALWLNVKLFGW